jgi:hypothetical protein
MVRTRTSIVAAVLIGAAVVVIVLLSRSSVPTHTDHKIEEFAWKQEKRTPP